MRVLVVDDEPRLTSIIQRSLAEAGYAVDVAHTSDTALEQAAVETYDLMILDVMLAGSPIDGYELCTEIRRNDPDVPILMLTALGTIANRVTGLDGGADDYVVKPIHVLELLARVRALLRRAPRADAPVLTVGSIALDPASRQVTCDGQAVELTAKEFAVLEYLMRNAGRVVSASELIDHAWDSNYEGYSNVVQTYIRYLRRKLGAVGAGEAIQTHRGAGYVMRVDG
ncbi:response regulator transcription factor [Demequina capsici]|uniref:Response regulator transcription factor n=1 Tax=Demequina capsici TaxID=3075620 RepID=A0AA96FC55_9MICO|nr:response regulator transcription factor [Demequina sp. PMTSA13]WNM26747.1 response regulator transcription factor [Demequina sp. PMTSA13]